MSKNKKGVPLHPLEIKFNEKYNLKQIITMKIFTSLHHVAL